MSAFLRLYLGSVRYLMKGVILRWNDLTDDRHWELGKLYQCCY